MKITKRQLKRIIKEEKAKLLREAGKEYAWPEVEFKSTNPYDDQASVGLDRHKDDAYDKLEKAISEATETIGEDAVLKFLSTFVGNY